MSFAIDLEGNHALVTGAGRGVGRAIACALAEAGASVHVNDLRDELTEETIEALRAAGGSASAVPFDVTDYDAVQKAISALGALDILVNNAGNAGTQNWDLSPFAETSPSDWDRYLDINLYGVMYCTRAALPKMIERRYGRIVTIVSDIARWGEPYLAPYAAAKAGASGFGRSIAREVGRYGITVNNVALGTLGDTDVDPDTGELSDADRKALSQYIVRRRGRPADVAPMVTLLVSPLAEWITGQTIPVNGGYTVNL